MWSRVYDSHRGFTLLEVLLSGTVVLLVLSLGAYFLIPLLTMQVRGAEEAELRQRATLVLDELRSDVAQSRPAGWTVRRSPEEVVLAFHRFQDVAQDGTLVWQDQLVLHRWLAGEARWVRSLWSDPQRRHLRASAPTRLSDSELDQALRSAVNLRVTQGVTAVFWNDALPVPLLDLQLTLVSPGGQSLRVRRTLDGRLPSL